MSCGIGGDLFAIVWERESGRLAGLNASGRAPYAATVDYYRGRGHAYIPDTGPLNWSVPGCVDGWARLLERFGTMSLGTGAGTCYLLRGERVSRIGHHRAGLGGIHAPAESLARVRACLPARWTGSRTRRGVPERGPGPVLPPPGRRGPRRVLPWRDRRSHRGLFKGRRRAVQPRGLQGPHVDMGRSRLRRLPRPYGLGAAAERTGHRRAADAEHPGRVRPRRNGLPVGRDTAPSDRSQETRLRRPGGVLRPIRPSRTYPWRPCCPGLTPTASARASIPAGRAVDVPRPAIPYCGMGIRPT